MHSIIVPDNAIFSARASYAFVELSSILELKAVLRIQSIHTPCLTANGQITKGPHYTMLTLRFLNTFNSTGKIITITIHWISPSFHKGKF